MYRQQYIISGAMHRYLVLLYQLVHDLSENARQDYDREEQNGWVVMIASILLSLGRARNTANNFSRMLGIYLQGLGLKRRGLDSYRAIDAAKKTLSVRSEECSYIGCDKWQTLADF
jgi:hypothetical protein